MRRTRTSWAAARTVAVADDVAGENNTPIGSNNNRAQQRGRRAEHFFPDAPQSSALLPQCVNRRGGDAAAREENLWKEHENKEGMVHRALHEMLSLDEWTVPNFCKMLKLPAPESVRR